MKTKTTQVLLRTLAALLAIVALETFYQLGYRNGTRDVLDEDFSALKDGRLVSVGKGSSLFHSARRGDRGPTISFTRTIERPISLPTNRP